MIYGVQYIILIIKKIYLVKSYESNCHKEKIFTPNPKLTAQGLTKLNKHLSFYECLNLQKIYSSPRINNIESAKIISKSIGQNFSQKDIREEFDQIDLGNWDGLSYEKVKEKWPERYKALMNHPNFDTIYIAGSSETFKDVTDRVVIGLKDILKQDYQNVLIITHREVINIALMYILNFSEDKLWCFAQNHGGITLLTFNETSNFNIAFVNRKI